MTQDWTLPPPEEAERHQKEVIAEALKTLPYFELDPRQENFFAFVDKMRKEGDEDLEVLSMGGFRASNVDLAWLLDCFAKLVKDLYIPYGPFHLMPIMDGILCKAIQRLKARMMNYDQSRDTIEVIIMTLDDYGSYEYRLGIPTPIEHRGNE